MIRFCIKRLFLMIPVLIGVLFLTFTMEHFMPGDPVVNYLPTNYTQEQYDTQREKMGLDKPFLVQFGTYLYDLITKGDLGTSYTNGRPVTSEMHGRIGITLKLGILSVCLTMLLGIPIGILSATHRNSPLDYTATTVSIFLAAMPGFWLALMCIILFSLKLKWLPTTGLSSWKHYILPVLCNGLMPLAVTTRMTRSSMLEVIRQDYIRTARAKGLSERKVIFRHALTNALIPIITVVGGQFSIIMGGSIVIESIFSIPGMGMLMVTAINGRNYPVVMGVTFIIALFVCIVNLLVDIIYAAVDPRIKAQFVSSAKRLIQKDETEHAEEGSAQ